MKNIKVSSYWGVPNQFIICTDEGRYFQSYDSIIAFIPNDRTPIRLGKDWDYYSTTEKYRNKFLNESTAETVDKLAKGIYILDESL